MWRFILVGTSRYLSISRYLPSDKFKNVLVTLNGPSRQILVPKKSRVRPSPTSPGRFLKVLFPSQGSSEMTSRGRPSLKFKGHPWEGDWGRTQGVLMTSPIEPSKNVFAGLSVRCPKIYF